MLSLHAYQDDTKKKSNQLSFYETKQKIELEKLKKDIEKSRKELISSIVSIIKKDSQFKNCNFSK